MLQQIRTILEPSGEEFCVSKDADELVVEIVRDSTREIAYCLHLVRMTKLVLEALGVRDVSDCTDDADHAAAAGVQLWACRVA